jgi:hypothetical protein
LGQADGQFNLKRRRERQNLATAGALAAAARSHLFMRIVGDETAAIVAILAAHRGEEWMQRLLVLFAVGAALSVVAPGILVGALAGAAHAAELPAGPNRALVTRECQACHDLDNVIDAAGSSRSAWNATLDAMTGYGLSVTPEDRTKILDYLATALGPKDAPR